MFDFSRLAETISGLVGAQTPLNGEGVGSPEGLQDLLTSVGLDPSVLNGLSEAEIGDLLAGYGIDVARLGEGPLAELVETVSGSALERLSAPWGESLSPGPHS